jgi:uncharacterized protein YbaP (TraB family)
MRNYKNDFINFLVILLSLSLVLLSFSCAGPTPQVEEPVTSVPPATPVVETTPSPTPFSPPEVTPTTQPTTEEVLPPSQPLEEKGKSFAWKITSDTTSVYLLGSIHVARPAIYPLDRAIEDAFKEADNLVVEVNVTAVDEEESFRLLQEYGTYPAGDGFSKNVPKDVYDELYEYLEQGKIFLVQLEQFRPWVILTILEQYAFTNLGYKAEYGIDYYFLDKANVSKKNIIELESAEFQLKLLSNISDDIMIEAIESDLDDMLTQEDIDELFDAWINGDRDAIEEITFEGLEADPELQTYYETLFDVRNLGMAEKIVDFLAGSETYFIVVGAGHLVGDKGLLDLLENRGYSLEQLVDVD